ncbi:unnamed protein product, partial [Cyprideis torosa]
MHAVPLCTVSIAPLYLALGSLTFAVRPTVVIFWLPLVLHHFWTSPKKLTLFLVAFTLFTLMVVIHVELDTLFHGSFLISALEFFKVNILRGLGSFYGTHPWFWYFLVGLPTLLGPHLVPFLMSLGSIPRSIWPLLATILFSVVCLSVLPHKEFRFL